MKTNSFTITPIVPKPSQSGVDFGAIIHGLDIEKLTDDDFKRLEEAVYTHQVLIVPNQGHLSPKSQFELTQRFDPGVDMYGHGAQHRAKDSVLARDLSPLPDVPQVQLLGHGKVRDHFGVEERDLRHPDHRAFHAVPLRDEEIANDKTRFYRWHMDAALYKLEPTKVTTLFGLKNPEPRRQTVQYDDGTGHTLDVQLGTTAFISGQKAFELLPLELKDLAARSKVKYAPHPYLWMSKAGAKSNGLGLVSQGKELSPDDLPPIVEEDIKIYPMLWKNPVTGKVHLQVHPAAVQDIITDGKPVGDLEKVRDILYKMQRPAINPENVYAHEWQDGDLVIFHNRGVLHTVVGCMKDTDERIFHQCVLASNSPPLGATQDDVKSYFCKE